MRAVGDHPVRFLLVAVALAAVGAIKGTRIFWDEIDRATSWLVEKTDGLDMGWDVPDHLPETWVES